MRPASAMKTVPTGLALVPPDGPAMPVTAMAKVRAEFFPGAFGHFPRHGRAHRAVPGQDFRPDAKKCPLHFVAVSHNTARENFGRARHIRDPMRDQSAGAGFGRGQGQFPFRQQADDGSFNFVAAALVCNFWHRIPPPEIQGRQPPQGSTPGSRQSPSSWMARECAPGFTVAPVTVR